MKLIISFITLVALLLPSISQASLYNYYDGNLPSISERSVTYAEIANDKYVGSASQNNALESYLRQGVLGATTKIKLTDTNAVTPAATSTPTANMIPIANASGTLEVGWYDGVTQAYIAGESIDATSVPLAVYLKSTDGRVYKTSSAEATTTFTFIGFAQSGQSKTAGQSINIQHAGIVSGFTGMTTGSIYFVSTAGTVSSTAGTVTYKIGKAVSPTTLLIEKGKKILSGYISSAINGGAGGSNQSTTTIATGFYPNKIQVFGLCDYNNSGEYPQSYNKLNFDVGLNGNEGQWINNNTLGFSLNKDASNTVASDTTYLIRFFGGSLYSRLLVGNITENNINLLHQTSLASDGNPNDVGVCKYNYIIE